MSARAADLLELVDLTVLGISLGITTVVALGVVTESLKASSGEILKLGGADFMVAQEGAADLSFSIISEDASPRTRHRYARAPATPTPRPLIISVSFEPEAQLRLPDDSVTIRGTVTCSAPGSVDIEVVVQQSVKGATVIAAAPNSEPIACNGQTQWSATGRPEYGRFRPGYGEALVRAFASGSGG